MTDTTNHRSGLITGGTILAATLIVMSGIFQIMMGIAAIARNAFFIRPVSYPYDLSTTGWGWIHLILGILLICVGAGLYARATWARMVGVVVVVLAAIDNFLFLPFYPLWTIVLIALDAFILWALIASDRVRNV